MLCFVPVRASAFSRLSAAPLRRRARRRASPPPRRRPRSRPASRSPRAATSSCTSRCSTARSRTGVAASTTSRRSSVRTGRLSPTSTSGSATLRPRSGPAGRRPTRASRRRRRWRDRSAEAAGTVAATASNHSLDQGQSGINSTVKAFEKRGLEHTGSFATPKRRAGAPRSCASTASGSDSSPTPTRPTGCARRTPGRSTSTELPSRAPAPGRFCAT